MAILRDVEKIKIAVDSKLKAIFSELLDSDAELAEQYVIELHDKIISNKNHEKQNVLESQLREIKGRYDDTSNIIRKEVYENLEKVKHKNLPSVIVKGDIIYVKYGIGIGDELRKGHYGIVLARRGWLYLIAPLTKTLQPHAALNITFSGLSLPGEDDTKTSYISYNHIKFVHIRRMENIIKLKKIHITDKEKINRIFTNYFEIVRNSLV